MYGLNNGIPFRDLLNGYPQQATNGRNYKASNITGNFSLFSNSDRPQTDDSVDSILSTSIQKDAKPRANSPPSSIQHRYEAAFPLYAMNWSTRKDVDKKFRLAIGSCQDITGPQKGQDTVQILQLQQDDGTFNQLASFQHSYPPNKIAWIPDVHGRHPDLLATSGDYLRIWQLDREENKTGGQSIQLALVLNNNVNASAEGRPSLPLTSFDWNQADPTLLVTASLDNSCTVWTLETGQAVASQKPRQMESKVNTQLLAHEKHVYDVAFTHHTMGSRDIFASVGDEGSLRQFDMRNLVQSTVLHQDPHDRPLVRLAWGKHQPNYLAFFAQDSNQVTVLDIRFTAAPLAQLSGQPGLGHTGNVNGMSWASHAENHIVTVGDDQQVLIWDIQQAQTGPILNYNAEGAVNQVHWSEVQPAWLAICYDNCLELLRVG